MNEEILKQAMIWFDSLPEDKEEAYFYTGNTTVDNFLNKNYKKCLACVKKVTHNSPNSIDILNDIFLQLLKGHGQKFEHLINNTSIYKYILMVVQRGFYNPKNPIYKYKLNSREFVYDEPVEQIFEEEEEIDFDFIIDHLNSNKYFFKKEIDGIDWFDVEIFVVWSKLKSKKKMVEHFKIAEKKISATSIYLSINLTKKYINNKFKKQYYDNLHLN